jgi:hypothetical protein
MEGDRAATVLAALQGQITVVSTTAGAASSSIDAITGGYSSISIDDGAGGGALGAYLTCALDGADPTDPAPTSTSGNGRTQWYSAAQLAAGLIFPPAAKFKVWVEGTGTVYVRQNRSSS